MAEQRSTVHATIRTIGDIQQVTPKFSKFTFEYAIGDSPDVYNAESPAWHRGALEAGSTYELVLKANQTPDGDFYTPSIDAKPVLITGAATSVAKPNPPTAKPSEKSRPAPAVNEKQTSGRRPELNSRWVQYSTHSRTAQMQATERVGQYIKIAIEGRLVTDEDVSIQKLRKSTIEGWYSEEIDRYWKELEQREPNDWFGNLRDES